jgi:hypothetical protein
MGRYTRWALGFSLLAGSWLAFVELEPRFFPVIKNFVITEAVAQKNNTVYISGSFTKVRECKFTEVVAYSGPTLIRVVFLDVGKSSPNVTRLAREQFFGPWRLEPKTPLLELYATHECDTGRVITEVFSGALVYETN